MTTVLLAEDDPAIAEPLARALRREGYDVSVTDNGIDALAMARFNPDLLVLDLGLPDMDGLDVCRQLRSEGNTLPILILTARAEEVDAVVGLDAGADDYVTKPFRLGELLARARAMLRRSPPVSGGPQQLVIDEDARRVLVGGREIRLTSKEFELMRVLLREQGKVVSREQLMREIWETDWVGSTKTLDMHVSVLRRKLGDDPADPVYITTVRGVGFRFETGTDE